MKLITLPLLHPNLHPSPPAPKRQKKNLANLKTEISEGFLLPKLFQLQKQIFLINYLSGGRGGGAKRGAPFSLRPYSVGGFVTLTEIEFMHRGSHASRVLDKWRVRYVCSTLQRDSLAYPLHRFFFPLRLTTLFTLLLCWVLNFRVTFFYCGFYWINGYAWPCSLTTAWNSS